MSSRLLASTRPTRNVAVVTALLAMVASLLVGLTGQSARADSFVTVGSVSAPAGQNDYAVYDQVIDTAGPVTASVTWTGDAEVDLYVQTRLPDGSRGPDSAYSVTSAKPEQATIEVEAGTTLRFIVKGSGGSADFELTVDDDPAAILATVDAAARRWSVHPVTVAEEGFVTAALDAPVGGDVRLQLATANGQVLASSLTSVPGEQLSHRVTPGDYAVRVRAEQGATAYTLEQGFESGTDLDLIGALDPDRSRYRKYVVTVPEDGLLTADLGSAGGENVDLFLRTSTGQLVANRKFVDAPREQISRDVAAGDYEVIVGSVDEAALFDVAITQQVGDDRQYRDGVGFTFANGRSQDFTVVPLGLPDAAPVTLSLDALDEAADLDLIVRETTSGDVVGTARTSDDPEVVSFTTEAGVAYEAVVQAVSGASQFLLDVAVDADGNVAPVVEPITDVTTAEDDPIETIEVEATDEDGDTLTYGATGLPFGLDIDGDTGDITGTPTVPGEYPVTVGVDDGTEVTEVSFTITVTNVNDQPEAFDATFAVAEDAAVDDAVGTVVATDVDSADLTFSITAGNDDDDVAIDAATGDITVAQPLDAETTPQYVLTVEVSDGELSDTATITVDVTDTNEAPAADDDTFTVAEDAEVDLVVGTVTASDPEGDTLAYAITAGNDDGDLAIDVDTGQVTVDQALDFETTPQYVLTVEVSDGVLSATATITVDVTDVDEPEPCTPVSTLDCDELLVTTPYALTFDGTEGGLADSGFTLVDPPSNRDEPAISQDPAPATPSFPDVPGFEPGLLTVDGNLTIDATKGIQYATPDPVGNQQTSGTPGINAQLNSLGVAVEGGADSYELTTTVVAPAFDVPSGSSQQAGLTWFVDEDTYIKLVVARTNNTTNMAQLAVETLDAPTADDDDGFFELNDGSFGDGQDVELRMVIDAEAQDVTGFYTVAGGTEQEIGSLIVPNALLDGVVFGDGLDPAIGAGLFATKRSAPASADVSATFADFSVTATANTAPEVITPVDVTVDEDAEITPIQVEATDAEGDTLTYSSTGLPEGLSLAGDTGLVTGTPTVAGSYPVDVTVNDGNGGETTVSFTITVTEVNDQPVVEDDTFTVPEDATVDTSVGTVSAADEEGTDLAFAITAGNDDGDFAIDEATGEITVAQALDFDATPQYVLTVEASDGDLAGSASITIDVTERAPACEPVSTLPCGDLQVDTPYTLDFDGTQGGLADTGFTLVDAPSSRDDVDQSPAPATPSFPDVPGYEPGLLTVDGDLTIDATKGIQYATPDPVNGQQTSGTPGINAQLNGLGVAVAGGADGYELTTTLVAPVMDTPSGSSQQGGLWWFVDEDAYIKLVVVRVNDTEQRVQLAVESLDAPTADDPDGFIELNGPNIAQGVDVALRMVVDADTGLVTAFYDVDGAGEVQLANGADTELIVPSALLDGVALDAGLDPTVNAGVFATKRAADAGDSLEVTFADFSVDAVAGPANTPPTIEAIADATATEGEAITPIAIVAGDVDGDDVTVTVDGLPAGLSFDDVSAEITGTPDAGSAATYDVTVTADDGTDTTEELFSITVLEAGDLFAADVNFSDDAFVPPTGFVRDFGEAFGARTGPEQGTGLTYGWIDVDDASPISLVGQGRDRSATGQSDPLLATTIHMEHPSTPPTGFWEIAVPDGTYEVTVGAGDASGGTDPEVHRVNAEGVNVIDDFAPSGPNGSDTRHTTDTAAGIVVTDGALTLDYTGGGVNTKLNYVEITQVSTATGGGNTAPEVLLTGDRTLVNGQDTIIPVDSFDEDDDTVTLDVTGLPAGLTFDGTDIVGTVAGDADAGSPYTVEVTGDDGEDTTTETFSIEVIPALDVQVNFQDEDFGTPPAGYLADFGQAYGTRTGTNQGTGLSYGWVAEGTTTPLSLVGNARERGRAAIDDLTDTMIHMQYGDIGTVYGGNPNCTSNVCDAGAWEIAVPNGLYEVTVSVGDQPGAGDVYDSLHAINVESGLAILEFQADGTNEYLEATAQAGVEDGRLTINAVGGANTKMNYVEVRSLGTQPFATQMIPENRATDVAIDSGVSASVSVPGTGVGVDPSREVSLTDEAVKLFKLTPDGEEEVAGGRGSTGGNDTINFSPQPSLEYDTTYRYVIDGVLDEAGNTFGTFQSTFSTEEEPDDPDPGVCADDPTLPECQFSPVEGVDFEKVLIPEASGTNGKFIASLQVHQGHLWYTTIGQGMFRHEILADGELGPQEDLGVLQGRAAIGLVFDENDPDVAWVTHATANLSNESARTGSKVSRVDFSIPASPVVQDIFVNLPRSQKDHLSNSMIYGPSGDGGGDWLYFLQGSNQAAGDTDGAWGSRGETQLTAALLRFDPQDVLAEVAANGPIDVATPEVGGSYDPFANGALLEVYATGIRNAFDLVWHSNGQIYVPTNGTAAGGSSPGVSADGSGGWVMQSADPRNAQTGYDQGTDVTDECATHRGDGSYSDVLPVDNDGSVTAHTGLPTQLDYVFTVEEGRYYGHPNPTRCEWVMNNGSDSLSGTGNFYGPDQDADPNYDEDGAYSLDFNKSPNGVIEYQSETFGGDLQGRVMIVRFSNNDDILTMQVAPDGTILGDQAGTTIGGFSGGYADPLELTEDTEVNPGNLYLNQYNRAGEPQQLYLLRVPDGQQAATIDVDANQAPAVGDALIMSATLNGEGPTDSQTVTVTNEGDEAVDVTAELSGANAGQFGVGNVGTIAAGASADVDVTFDPTGSSAGVRTATVTFSSPDDTVILDVRALAHVGQEGGEEPTLQQVFDTFDFGLDSGWSGLAGGTDATPVGDEVDVDLFERAVDGPVIVTPVAAFAPFEDLPFGWYADADGAVTLNEVGVLPNGQQQTLVPDSTPTAPLEFDPGTDAFGFYYDSNTFNRVGHTEDARNTDGVPHRARIYPLPGNAFYVGFEDASNGDYQDYNFILENVVAAGDDGGGGGPDPIGDTLAFNFQLEDAPVPADHLRDFGEAYGVRTGTDQGDGLTYGWVDDETFEPLSLVGNGRDRDSNDDQRLDTLMHMDLPPDGAGGVLNDGTWELAIADGTYEVTAAVGDPDLGGADESHTINVEGVSLIDAFPKSTAPDGSDDRHTTGTATVEVTDGKLTIDQIGGVNTKINYLEVTPVGTGGGGDVVAQVNFQPAASPTPTDWVADGGELFTAGRGYGWVNTEGGNDKTADTRDRGTDTDQLLDTFVIVDDAQVAATVNGEWEYALANGSYTVEVSVGDPDFTDSTHTVTAEGVTVVDGFVPSGATPYASGSEVVEVSDGRLTLASAGTNTKFQWVRISSTGGVDVVPPQVGISLDGSGSGNAFTGPVTVTLDITDATLEFVDVVIDGTPDTSINAQNFDTPFEVTGTGNHTVEVTATDGAGNATTETAEFSIIETGDGALTLTNPEAAPFDDRLVMSRIQSTAQGPATNDTATIELGNDGTEDLVVTNLDIADGDDFELVSPPGLPATIAVGGSIDVEVLFDGVGSGDNELLESTLTVTHDGSNGPATPVELAGQWQTRAEQGNEPNVAEIVEAFGFGTTIVGPGEQINNQGRLEAIGDEVLSRTWAQADPATDITVRQLAAYHSCCSNTATFKWHQVGSKGASTNVLTHNGQWAQTLLPRINGSQTNPAVATFDPNPAEFSLSIDPESSDWTLNNTGPDSCGGGNAGCQLGHHLRLWPSEDRDGDRIPNQWIVVMDYSGINYDFNDNVYLVDNLKPTGALVPGAPAAPTGLAAGLEGSSVRLDWDANTDDDLDGYHVERSVEGASFERLTTDPIGATTYLDTSAPAESSIDYRIIAVDQAAEESDPSATASVDTPVLVVPTERVNAGGPEVTTGGNLWTASQYLSGGKTYENSTPDIAGTTDDVLYHTEYSTATGTINLDVPVDDGDYEVRLHFAEIYFQTPGGTNDGGSGSRVFDVSVEGNLELDDYDIIADVGSATAVVKTFPVTITDGNVDVDLVSVTNQAKLSAFEIVPVTAP